MNVIIDTGCANLSSLKFAIERLDAKVEVTADKSLINSADKVFLPGVGTAKHAMNNIRERDLVDTIKQLEQPVLGICLGMQLMTDYSYEGREREEIECLGIIPTGIDSLCKDEQNKLRVPHMGWNTFSAIPEHPLFEHIDINDYFYYVHSYGAPVSQFTIAQCRYNAYVDPNKGGDGVTFSAALAKDNFAGVQFHPEKSGKIGSLLLNNFLEMKA